MRRYSALLCILILVAICSVLHAAEYTMTGNFYSGTGAVSRGTSPVLMDTIEQPIVGVSYGCGLTLEHGVWHSGPESTYVASIGDLKKIRDYNGLLSIYSLPVTAGTDEFGDYIYIERSDQSGGVRVQPLSGSFSAGSKVHVLGKLGTNSDGERFIRDATITLCGTEDVGPVMLSNKDLGGQDMHYNPITGAGQRGVEDGVGLNNIGLLVTTFGKVSIVGSDWFYIDDGYHAHDFSIFNGIRVRCGTLTKPSSGDYVFVTGISSIMKVNDRLFRSIRPRTQEDIQISTE